MRIVNQREISRPFFAPLGEAIYEMIGKPEKLGGTEKHSLAYVKLHTGKKSPAHFHQVSEETYYVLKGKAQFVLDGVPYNLDTGDAVLIMPREVHQIRNAQQEDLEFLAISAPAWVPDDTFEANVDYF